MALQTMSSAAYTSPDGWPDDRVAGGSDRAQPDATAAGIDDLQWLALLARIREAMPEHTGPERRAETPSRERFSINEKYLLRIDDGPSTGAFVVRARNLAARGLGFVHGQPLTVNARCTIVLTDRGGFRRIVTGRVAWQRRVAEHLYDTGIEFDESIDVLRFLETD